MANNVTNVNEENTTVATEVTTVILDEKSTEEVTAVAETTAVEHKIGFTPESLDWSLPIMGKGMLGIFIVTTIIVTVTVVLNKATAPRKKNKEKKDK
jgi:hypothetical protein